MISDQIPQHRIPEQGFKAFLFLKLKAFFVTA